MSLSTLVILCLTFVQSKAWTIWPQPSNVTVDDSNLVEIVPSSNFFVVGDGKPCPTLEAAFERYHKLTFTHAITSTAKNFSKNSVGSITKLNVFVDDYEEFHPQLETDESYRLTVAGGEANLMAKTIYGILHGLETFSQLTNFDFENEKYVMPSLIKINDNPRFPHRGLMVDVSRHWESLQSLKNIIDSLTYAKLNVLHIHMSDIESFPYQVKSSPKLWEGAYSKFERYTVADMEELVEYARLRGVRVIVEFDMPGHADSWCKGYPEVCPSPDCTSPLNIASDATWNLIAELIYESQMTFVDKMMHLGGDEVDTSCWDQVPSIKKWLRDRNMTAHDGYADFVKRAADLVSHTGRRPIQWSEVFEEFGYNTSKDIIIHVWKKDTNLTYLLEGGYNALVNVGYWDHSWYLDNLDIDWSKVYDYDPCDEQRDEHCKLIYGGHGEMWGETVDGSDLEQTVWPRLAAIAERLWSPRNQNNVNDALPRIEQFRCRLLERGVAVAPVQNKNAREAPPKAGACASQR